MGSPIEILQAVDPKAATALTMERLAMLKEITSLRSRLALLERVAEAAKEYKGWYDDEAEGRRTARDMVLRAGLRGELFKRLAALEAEEPADALAREHTP